MVECKFCKIINGELPSYKVYEDDYTFAFLDNLPVSFGHTLVVPKKHILNIFELPKEEIEPLFSTVKLLSIAVKEAMNADGIFIAINNIVSQSVPHIHIHIIPRYYNDKMHGFFWPRKRYSDEQAKNVQDLIIKKLGDINEYKQR